MAIVKLSIAAVLLLCISSATAKPSDMANDGSAPQGRRGRRMNAWGGYSGSWSGSWGSSSTNVDANGQSSGSWNTPYSSGTWGSGGSTSTTPNTNTNTNNNNNNNNNNNQQQQQQTPASPPPPNGPAPQPAVGDVYYNGNGVLVQKLPDGSTQTVVNNPYAQVNVVAGRRRFW